MSALLSTREACQLLVVGAGPAGVACALQASRAGLNVLLASDEPVGGLLRAARRIENLPGFPAGISGIALADAMERQIRGSQVRLRQVHVDTLTRRGRMFEATCSDGERVIAPRVVLAVGTAPASYTLSGIAEGQREDRVHRDVRSLPPRLDRARVLIVGGGEAALDTALSCLDRGARVVLCYRGDRPRACGRLVEQVAHCAVEQWAGCVPLQVVDAGRPLAVRLASAGLERSEVFDHMVVCVGRRPCTSLVEPLAPLAVHEGHIETGLPGLFLAGDVIRGRDRYIASAMGDGQRAAMKAAAAALGE